MESVCVAIILIRLGIEACEFRSKLDPQPTGFTIYFDGREQLGDDVLVFTPLQELALAVHFLFKDAFTSEMIAAVSESGLLIWASLLKDRDLAHERFDGIYLRSELACLISHFDCRSDCQTNGLIFTPFRDGDQDSSAARIIKELCFTLCTKEADAMLISSVVDPKTLVCRFAASAYKVFASYLYFLLLNNFYRPSATRQCT